MHQANTNKLYIDENIARMVAGMVLLIALAGVAMQWGLLFLLLSIDFAIRAFTSIRSPLAVAAKALSAVLGLTPRPVFAAPKKFAALMGFFFTLSIGIFFTVQFSVTAYAVSAVLVICAILESVFSICVGCYVYDWLVAPWVNKQLARRNNKS